METFQRCQRNSKTVESVSSQAAWRRHFAAAASSGRRASTCLIVTVAAVVDGASHLKACPSSVYQQRRFVPLLDELFGARAMHLVGLDLRGKEAERHHHRQRVHGGMDGATQLKVPKRSSRQLRSSDGGLP